jgi:hypothetical protein
VLFTQIFGDMPVSSHSTFISLPDEQELSAVSRNTEVDLFTHTEIKPAISTGNTTATAVPDAPVEIFEPVVTVAITGTVVLTALVPFLLFVLTGTVVLTGFTGLTVFTVLAGTVVLVAVVGNADTANTSTLTAAFATDTLNETHDAINKTKTKNRLTTTPPAD